MINPVEMDLLYTYVLNGTPKKPVCPIRHWVHQPVQFTIHIFEFSDKSLIHPKCILIYQPASTTNTHLSTNIGSYKCVWSIVSTKKQK